MIISFLAWKTRLLYRVALIALLSFSIYQQYEIRDGQQAIWELIHTKFISVKGEIS